MIIKSDQGCVEIYNELDSFPDYSESFWTSDGLICFIKDLLEAGQKAFGEDQLKKSVAALEKDA